MNRGHEHYLEATPCAGRPTRSCADGGDRLGLIGTVATGFLGMNLLALADSSTLEKIGYFVIVLIPITALTLYTIVKSKRLSDFLEALSDERMPAAAKFKSLLDVWKRAPRRMLEHAARRLCFCRIDGSPARDTVSDARACRRSRRSTASSMPTSLLPTDPRRMPCARHAVRSRRRADAVALARVGNSPLPQARMRSPWRRQRSRTVADAERDRLLDALAVAVRVRVPMIAGASATDAEATLRHLEKANRWRCGGNGDGRRASAATSRH